MSPQYFLLDSQTDRKALNQFLSIASQNMQGVLNGCTHNVILTITLGSPSALSIRATIQSKVNMSLSSLVANRDRSPERPSWCSALQLHKEAVQGLHLRLIPGQPHR